MTPVVGVAAAPAGEPVGGHPQPPPVRERPGHCWEPASGCGPGCLPAADVLPRVSRLRVAGRLAGLVALLVGLALTVCVYPLLRTRRRSQTLRGLFRAMLRVVGVRLVHIERPVGRGVGYHPHADRFHADGVDADLDGLTERESGVLVVANHLSWLDVLALGAVAPMRMVAKSEIRDWPVVGPLAGRVGTFFVDRAGLRSLPAVVAEVAEALRDGSVVGLFPEGTTWCGGACGPFRRAGFQAAIDAGVPVRPVAQRMRLVDGTPTSVGAFIAEETLLASLLRVVRLPELVLEVEILPALLPESGVDRRELARRAELAIAAATGVPAPASTARHTAGGPVRVPPAAA